MTRNRDGLTIAAVSELLGVPIPTIRSWEHRYGFPEPVRTEGKHRRYGPEQVDQLITIRGAIVEGLSASEAVALARSGPTRSSREPAIEFLLRAVADLDPAAVRSTIELFEGREGVEATITRVVLPAMHEVGERWKAGTCDIATEHLLTDMVRRWLARLATFTPLPERPRVAVLACGPSELHSVGLEAFGVLLGRRGWAVTMLGQMTPGDSLEAAVRRSGAKAAVVVAQRSINRRSTAAVLGSVSRLLGAHTFYGGGAFASAAARRGVRGTYLGIDLEEAAGTVDRAVPSSSVSRPATGAG